MTHLSISWLFAKTIFILHDQAASISPLLLAMNPHARIFSPSLHPQYPPQATEPVVAIAPSSPAPLVSAATQDRLAVLGADLSSEQPVLLSRPQTQCLPSNMDSNPRFRNLVNDLADASASLLSPDAENPPPPYTSLTTNDNIVQALETWNKVKASGIINRHDTSPSSAEPASDQTTMIKVTLVFE
jgi:hypothetical protein